MRWAPQKGFGLGLAGFGLQNRRLAHGDVGHRAFIGRLVSVEAGLGQRFGRAYLLRPLPVSFGLVELGLQLAQIGFRPLQPRSAGLHLGLGLGRIRGIQRVVDLGQDRSLLDGRAVVDGPAAGVLAEGHDLPGDLGAHVDHLFRLHRAGGADGNQQVAAFYRCRAVGHRRVVAAQQIPGGCRADQPQHEDAGNGSFHPTSHAVAPVLSAIRPREHPERGTLSACRLKHRLLKRFRHICASILNNNKLFAFFLQRWGG